MKFNPIPRSYSEDTVLDEDIQNLSPISASGDFTVRSINAIGPAVFRKNLLVKKDGSFHSLLLVNGECTIDGKLTNKGNVIIDGDLFAKELDCDFLDIRARWIRHAVVDDLKIGVVADDMLALRRGLYGWLEESVCDICNQTHTLSCVDGKAMCEECEDKLLRSDDQ